MSENDTVTVLRADLDELWEIRRELEFTVRLLTAEKADLVKQLEVARGERMPDREEAGYDDGSAPDTGSCEAIKQEDVG